MSMQLTLFDFANEEDNPLDLAPLSDEETSRRTLLEDQALGGCLQLAAALLEIRRDRLYRSTHTTWRAYCADFLGMTRQRADQLIAAVDVVRDVSAGTITGYLPNERQARELVPLAPEQRRAVWEAATTDGATPTAAQLRERAAAYREAPAIQDAEWEELPFPDYPHSARLQRWLQALQTANDAIVEGGTTVGTLASAPDGWDWKELRNESLGCLESLEQHYASTFRAWRTAIRAAPEFRMGL